MTYFGDLSHAAQYLVLYASDTGMLLGDVLRITDLRDSPQPLEAGGGNVYNLLISYDLLDPESGTSFQVELGASASGPWVEVFRVAWPTADPNFDPPLKAAMIVPLTWPKMPYGQRVTHARVTGDGDGTTVNHLFVGLMWLRKHPEPAGGAAGQAPVIN